MPKGVKCFQADIHDEQTVSQLIESMDFDVVADFIAFEPAHVERDVRLFRGKTKQYIFISSAPVYQTLLAVYRVTEGTPASNPYWEYSRIKIVCEEYLMKQY